MASAPENGSVQRGRTRPRLTAVVVTRDGGKFLARCLEALRAAWPGLGLVLVDNASTDGSAERATRDHPGLVLIQNPRNQGFCRGANQGLAQALQDGADHVFLVNNDAFIAPDCLEVLADFLARTPRAGACQPLLVYDHRPEVVQSAGCGLGRTGRCFDLAAGQAAASLGGAPFEVPGVTGGAVLLRGAALRETGLFWPRFVMYFEDADLSLRLRGRGWSLHCLPGVRVRHVGGASGLAAWKRVARTERNALLLALRQYPPGLALAAAILGPLSGLGAAGYNLLRGRAVEAWGYLVGCLAGLAASPLALVSRFREPDRACRVRPFITRSLFPPTAIRPANTASPLPR